MIAVGTRPENSQDGANHTLDDKNARALLDAKW